MSEELLSISEAAKLLDVCEQTLRDWDIEKKFKAHRTAGGHRRYTLAQCREYLEKNPPKPMKETKFTCDAKRVVKWQSSGYLDPCESQEKQALAILLDNAQQAYAATSCDNLEISSNQYLWLTQQVFLRSKFKKMVAMQPMTGPCTMVYYMKYNKKNIAIESMAVAAEALSLCTPIIRGLDFEIAKDAYANALTLELDIYIAQKLPRINIWQFDEESIVGFDYIILPENDYEKFKNHPALENVDVFSMPRILDCDTLAPIAAAGNYPKNSLTPPVFSPYILFSIGPPLMTTHSIIAQWGWATTAEK